MGVGDSIILSYDRYMLRATSGSITLSYERHMLRDMISSIILSYERYMLRGLVKGFGTLGSQRFISHITHTWHFKLMGATKVRHIRGNLPK